MKIIRKEVLIASCSERTKDELVHLFQNVDHDNFLKVLNPFEFCEMHSIYFLFLIPQTSRDFLEFYNREVVKPVCIYSFKSFLMNINGKKPLTLEAINVDFNLRNLSISFFIDDNIWKNTKSGSSVKLFVEMDVCDVNVQTRKFNNPNYIELQLRPGRSQLLNQNDNLVEKMAPVEFLTLVVDDEHNLFMTAVYQFFRDKIPMTTDNLTDNDSLISFRTIATIDTPMRFDNLRQVANETPVEVRHIQSFHSATLLDRNSIPVEQDLPKKKHQTAKLKPQQAQAPKSLMNFSINPLESSNVYDDLPSDDVVLPPLKRFMAQTRLARKRKTQVDENADPVVVAKKEYESPDDLIWIPKRSQKVEKKKAAPKRKAAPVKKSSTQLPVKRARKPIDYSTEDESCEELKPLQKRKTYKSAIKKPADNSASLKKPNIEKAIVTVEVHDSEISPEISTFEGDKNISKQLDNQAKEVMEPTESSFQKPSAPPLPKKRVTFNASSEFVKHSPPSVAEHTSSDYTYPSTKDISEEERAKRQQQQDQQQTDPETGVVLNMHYLNQNEVLGMYINDSMTIRQEKVINNNDEVFNELIEVRTKTIQKKTSPTQFRSVQFQEINFPPLSEEVSQELLLKSSEGKCVKQLKNLLKLKTAEKLEPLKKDVNDLRESIISSKKQETKAKLRAVIANCRETKENIKHHVQEHIKLLKRLQYSKRKLTQYVGEDKQAIVALKTTLKQAVKESHQICKDGLKKIEEIKQDAINKEKETKTEVWHGYLRRVSDSIQQILQDSFDI